MAHIYLARMRGIEGFERLVVLKRLRPEMAERADIVRMFLDEIRLLASIQHANIVHIYDVGSGDAGYFYAMEFLHGQDLRGVTRKLQPNGIPLDYALFIISSILGGLHHVHERCGADGQPLRIVHRDISPSNIFVTYEGDVKLLDFGVAKAATQSAQTEVGVLKGKLSYMSPEQIRGEEIDKRSDIFSIGVVLWELITGKRLFPKDTDLKVMLKIIEGNVPLPSTLVKNCPPELESIVMRALATEPADRWQSARDMQAAIESFARENKLAMSATTLAQFMGDRFATEIEAWRAAQRDGKDLAAHIVEVLDELQEQSEVPAGTPSSFRGGVRKLAAGTASASGPVLPVPGEFVDAAPVEPQVKSKQTLLIAGAACIALVVVVAIVLSLSKTKTDVPVAASQPTATNAPTAPPVASPVTATATATATTSAQTAEATAPATGAANGEVAPRRGGGFPGKNWPRVTPKAPTPKTTAAAPPPQTAQPAPKSTPFDPDSPVPPQ
jgi:tRNA A-37 threonylcarbamoyl transferase component Bud32